MRTLGLICVVALAGCAATTEESAEESSATSVPGEAIGKAVPCLNTRLIESVDSPNENVAIIKLRGGKLYRSELPGGCPALKREAFSHRTTQGTQICSGEIITLFDPVSGASYGSCTFGPFVPIRMAKEAETNGY
jgi:hypothetical protein